MVEFVDTYGRARKYGVIHDSVTCIFMYLVMAFATGRPLKALAEDAKVYARQIEDVGNTTFLGMCRVQLSAILNLIEQSECNGS